MGIKFLLLLLAARVVFAADWETVRRISPDKDIDVRTRDNKVAGGAFISASDASLVLRSKSGERSISKDEIDHVRVADPSRRVNKGLLTTVIGAGVGLAIGLFACPSCANEGAPFKYTGRLTAIGAGVGATGFLSTPYRTVYKRR
ncbi:MAG TPA: hypothetical protein VEX68_13800 [Bryobacteraceae bacterium]|nr:hypothetical protein [Bryobacteraceae bacterium]